MGCSGDLLSPVDPAHVETFRRLLTAQLGLSLEDERLPALKTLLEQRLQHHRSDIHQYLQRLQSSESEVLTLSQNLTIGETYFFRHFEQMEAFSQQALPHRRSLQQGRPIRILSAGCSTGEEPYSLAMLAHQMGLTEHEVEFVGVDINTISLAKARRARYSAWALREAPRAERNRWFSQNGSEYTLSSTITDSVKFFAANLLGPDSALWLRQKYDIIFCRNVLMYFCPSKAREVLRRFHQLLFDDGYLFLGHAETLRDLSDDFELQSSHNCFYYRSPSGRSSSHTLVSPQPRPESTYSKNWFESIQASSDRVRQLSDLPALTTPTTSTADLSRIWKLYEQERYSEAMPCLQRLSPETLQSPEALLLQALLQLHLGNFEEAEKLCKELLPQKSFASGARYLLGLCREGLGDPKGAVLEHRAARTLDPGFAMPSLHLGLLARRADERSSARRELENALLLLQQEDISRLRMFASGFSRDSLLALCRSELKALPPDRSSPRR